MVTSTKYRTSYRRYIRAFIAVGYSRTYTIISLICTAVIIAVSAIWYPPWRAMGCSSSSLLTYLDPVPSLITISTLVLGYFLFERSRNSKSVARYV
jgi:hypothetical protein